MVSRRKAVGKGSGEWRVVRNSVKGSGEWRVESVRELCCLNHGFSIGFLSHSLFARLIGLRGLRGLKEYGGRDRLGWDSDRDRVPIEDLDSKSLN